MSRIPARPYIHTPRSPGGRKVKTAGVHYAEGYKGIGASIVCQHRGLFPASTVAEAEASFREITTAIPFFQQSVTVRCLDFGDGIFVILQSLYENLPWPESH